MFMAGRAANLAMKVLALAVLAIAYAAVTTHAAAQCGRNAAVTTHAFQCGISADGALCPNRLCCSLWGWFGYTDEFCGRGCHFSREHVGVGLRALRGDEVHVVHCEP